jgi:hypothetical protein
VDVGDDRDLRLLRDRRQRLHVVLGRHRDPDDLAAGGGQFGDLLQRRVHVGGQGRRHRLDADRRATADRHRSDHDLPGPTALGQRLRARGRNPEVHSGHSGCLT